MDVSPWMRIQWRPGVPLHPFPFYSPSWEGWSEKEHAALTRIKAEIEPFERDGTWELRKKLINPYELVYTPNEDKKLPICLAIGKPLSRSYFKMVEMLALLDFNSLFRKAHALRSAHVCEGPGGFIQAFFEKAEKPVEFSLAITLRPTQSQIPGWKRAAVFLERHPELTITYGQDTTGDIYSETNQSFFVREVGDTKVHLFTADGGFDVHNDYSHQEQASLRMIVCSFTIAFECLAKKGVCIVKVFDTFGKATQEFLAVVASFFKEWTLYKPAMSRPCNSERYFIGSGFRGTTPEMSAFLATLQHDLGEKSVHDLDGLFPQTESFRESLEFIQTLQTEFETEQILTVRNAIRTNLTTPHIYWRTSYLASAEWCGRFGISWKRIVDMTAGPSNPSSPKERVVA